VALVNKPPARRRKKTRKERRRHHNRLVIKFRKIGVNNICIY
jgi:hypothetical protein